MRIINVFLTVALFGQIICRLALSWHDREAKGLLLIWSLYTVALAVFNMFGEFRKPEQVVVYFPLVLTRAGRGAMFAFMTMPMFTAEWASVCLGLIVLLGAVFNIVIGWHDPPVTLKVVIDPSSIN